MNAPDFLVRRLHALWQRKGVVSSLLLPLSWLARWAIAHKKSQYRRHRLPVAQSRRPVIVVGNLYVGGTGKTPLVIALAQALQTNGWTPGIISRGYGAALGEQAKAGRGELDPRAFGDEPVLIAGQTQMPVAVHPRRALALRELERAYPQVDVVIADDGLQHLALGRDIEIVVQDARGLGNGRVLPAGPLREPASRLQDIDYLVTNLATGQAAPEPLAIKARQIALRLIPATVTHVRSNTTLGWHEWRARYGGEPIGAAAGIGQPDRYFAMLRAFGVTLQETIALPDHYPYAQSPFDALAAKLILITSKDAVKCVCLNDERLWAVHVTPEFSDPSWFDELGGRLHAIAKKKTA